METTTLEATFEGKIRNKTVNKIADAKILTQLDDILDTLEIPTRAEVRKMPGSPSVNERLKRANAILTQTLDELQRAIDKSVMENKSEQRIMIFVSVILFVTGISVIAGSILQNQLMIGTTGVLPELFIVWPFNNLRRIKDENTFLNTIVPWVKTRIAACEAKSDPIQVAECYSSVLRNLDKWITDLRKRAYEK